MSYGFSVEPGYNEGIFKPEKDAVKKEMLVVLNPDALMEHLFKGCNFW